MSPTSRRSCRNHGTEWPGGRPGKVELTLIDAVLSIRAAYGTKASEQRPATGVHRAVERYRAESGDRPLDDLEALAAWDPDRLADVLGNHQRTSGVLKAAAITEAAARLLKAGVRHAADVDGRSDEQRAAYCSVHGLGEVTWSYFSMLVGHPGVKADRWIRRFVEQAVGRPVSTAEAASLVTTAADRLEIPATKLDHAIWAHTRRAG